MTKQVGGRVHGGSTSKVCKSNGTESGLLRTITGSQGAIEGLVVGSAGAERRSAGVVGCVCVITGLANDSTGEMARADSSGRLFDASRGERGV